MPRKYARAPEADDIPAPDLPPYYLTPAEEKELREKVRAAMAKRMWQPGSIYRCPTCRANTLVGTNELSLEVPRQGKMVVYPGLKGAECTKCDAKYVESSETVRLEKDSPGPRQ